MGARLGFPAELTYILLSCSTDGANHMRAILIGTALTMAAGPVWAQTCSTFGKKTVCDNGTWAQRVGKTTTFSDGNVAYHSGNMTMNSDRTSSFRVGNTTYFSNGVTAHEAGNVVTFSNGRACHRLGNAVSCY